METELLQSLEDVGFTGPILEPTRFHQALQGGPNSPDFTNLVSWLTDQIGFFGKIDETVHPTSSPEDASTFMLELSIFLKELGCVNTKLTTGNVNHRLANMEDKSILLDYLISELMANKMLETKKPEDNKALEITISESITARTLREMLTALRFQKPPDNIAPDLLFKKLEAKVAEILKQVPKELVGKPMFFGELSTEQWQKLDKVQGDLNEEYTIRREMLLKRLDVTVQSFLWSERIRPKEDELNRCYHVKRDAMQREPDVTLGHLLSARDDLAVIEKTSNASVRKNTRSSINKVIIGAVPDRGGRPCEQEPPPPEMPSWQKDRVQGPQRGGFAGGGRGGGGGGRGGGRGGNQGGNSGGYRDNKSAANNFGQNFDSQKQFSNYGNQGGGYDNKNPSYSNQSSGYSNNQGSSYGNKSYNQSGYGNSQSSSGYSGQSSGYSGSSGYSNQSSYNNQSSYGNQSSGYGGQSGYSSQGSNYGNQGSAYNNQGANYGSQGGYDRKSGGGDYQKGGQGRGGRVQGGWNQGGGGGGGYNNRNQGQGGRRY